MAKPDNIRSKQQGNVTRELRSLIRLLAEIAVEQYLDELNAAKAPCSGDEHTRTLQQQCGSVSVTTLKEK